MFRRRTSSDNDARILIANSLVDIDPDYAVSASDLPNRGTGGTGYDLDTNVGTAANRKIHPSGSCLLFGNGANFASATDSNAYTPSTSLVARVYINLEDYTPSGPEAIIGHYTTTGNERGWLFYVDTTGALAIVSSPDGTATDTDTSTSLLPVSDGESVWLELDWDLTTGNVDFGYNTTDGPRADPDSITFTKLGNTVVNGTSCFNATTPLEIGSFSSGAAGRINTLIVSRAKLIIDGSTVADFDPTNYVSGTTFNTTMSDELVTNGGFDADSDWTKESGWSIGSGIASYDGTGGTSAIKQSGAVEVGKAYTISFDVISNEGTGANTVYLGGSTIVNSSHLDAGSYSFTGIASGDTTIFIYGRSGESFQIDNVSVVQVTPWTLNGNSFIQNTGHQVLHSIGSNGLETAAGQSITGPSTVFMVGAAAAASFAGSRFFFDARSNASARRIIYTDDSASDKYTLFQGANVTLDEALDADPHVFTAQFNGDATSKLTVSGVGSKTGNAGAQSWDFGRIFDSVSGGSGMEGYIARLLVFDYALSETQVSAIQNYLSAYYGGI